MCRVQLCDYVQLLAFQCLRFFTRESLVITTYKAFDERCLKAVFRCYQMDYPDYEFYCTCVASRKAFPHAENYQLQTISELCGYHLANHHHALADAEACAWIAREIL